MTRYNKRHSRSRLRSKQRVAAKNAVAPLGAEARRKIENLVQQGALSKRDLDRMRQAFDMFLGMVCSLRDMLGPAEPEAPRPKRARKSVAALCTKYLGAGSYTPVQEQTSVHESMHFLHRLVERGLAKPIPGFHSRVEVPSGKLHHHGRSRRFFRMGDETLTVKDYSGVLVSDPEAPQPLMLLSGWSVTAGAPISWFLLYHKPGDDPTGAVAAYEWLKKRRAELSPFRGQLTLVDGYSVACAEKPRRVQWSDIRPISAVRSELEKCLHMMRHPHSYRSRGLPVKRGVILAGPPGTGKTVHLDCLVSEVLAAELPVFQVTNTVRPEFLAEVYRMAEHAGPSLVVIEDLDTVAVDRDGYGDGINTGQAGALNALLNVLDGTEQRDGVITLATTNYPKLVDRALASRPGRFDRVFTLGYPSRDERLEILTLHLHQRRLNLDPVAALRTADMSWVLDDAGVTPAHLAEAVASVVRDQTANPDVDATAAFLSAFVDMRSAIDADVAFAKRVEEVGFTVAVRDDSE